MNQIAKQDENINQYINIQKNSVGADFLLLNKNSQLEILKNFESTDMNTLFSDITITQLWTLELLILSSLSPNDLIQRVWILREKFKLQCGEEIYKRYYDNLDDNLKKITLPLDNDQQLDALRADVVNIARQLQRLGYSTIIRSKSINERKSLVISLTIRLIIFNIFVFFLIELQYHFDPNNKDSIHILPLYTHEGRNAMKFLLLIISAGILGSAMSLLQRIEKAANIQPAFTDSVNDSLQITLSMSQSHIISLLVSGAVFALIINFISVSQLINILNSSLANQTNQIIPPCSIKIDLLLLISPPNNITETAKLLVFCFLSGFAERLVPDILDSLTKKSNK